MFANSEILRWHFQLYPAGSPLVPLSPIPGSPGSGSGSQLKAFSPLHSSYPFMPTSAPMPPSQACKKQQMFISYFFLNTLFKPVQEYILPFLLDLNIFISICSIEQKVLFQICYFATLPPAPSSRPPPSSSHPCSSQTLSLRERPKRLHLQNFQG